MFLLRKKCEFKRHFKQKTTNFLMKYNFFSKIEDCCWTPLKAYAPLKIHIKNMQDVSESFRQTLRANRPHPDKLR